MDFFKAIPKILRNPSFVLLAIIGGWQCGLCKLTCNLTDTGTFNSWCGSFVVILTPVGYSETTCGWIGFCATVASMTGGLTVGFLADKLFKKRFKLLLFILFCLSTLSLCWFTLSLPSIFSSDSVIPNNQYTIYTAIALGLCFWLLSSDSLLGGLFLGSTNPLFYELSAEITFPAAEEVSAVFLTLVMNVVCVVY